MSDAFLPSSRPTAPTWAVTRRRPLFGSPTRWAIDSAVFFGLAPLGAAAAWWVPALFWAQFGVGRFNSELMVGLVLGAGLASLLGAAVGAAMPTALQWSRARVPLALWVWFVGIGASALATTAGAAGALAVGAHPLMAMVGTVGLVVGAMATVGWLPYTVAATMERSPGRVLAALVLAAPVFGVMARGALALTVG